MDKQLAEKIIWVAFLAAKLMLVVSLPTAVLTALALGLRAALLVFISFCFTAAVIRLTGRATHHFLTRQCRPRAGEAP